MYVYVCEFNSWATFCFCWCVVTFLNNTKCCLVSLWQLNYLFWSYKSMC